MLSCSTSNLLLATILVIFLARPVYAFGAGNIASVAKIEGTNWRHGDIEDTLLTLLMSRAAGGKKFDKLNVARVYFGNWLRDYSQAIDVGTVKYVSAEAIRILLWVLGFMTFGYGTKEFEVTADRLGCYRPEDHIDNPKDYADNIDATKYDRRLRGPVNERVELAIDPQTGMKNYIANDRANIMTSAMHVRKLFNECILLGRAYARNHNKNDLHEALRLLGTGLHCLEDFSAHSNYIELALIEMGERDIFSHVGSRTQIRLRGARDLVYPLVTGTFGGVDFLHSVMGEFDDKATQSEIQELEGTMRQDSKSDTSLLRDLLSKIPSGVFGGRDEAHKADELKTNAAAAQMNQARISPRQPEEFTLRMQEVSRQIFPIIEWHDELMKGITQTIEKIPILPDLVSQLEEQVNIFVFSLIAPLVLPIINQVKNELNTGSSEIIQSSKDKQLVVFNDDHSSDPTHSMLSKDHFSNVLNEPAGKIASEVLKWVVPQLIQCWDDENVDANRTINRIINGVFHHPALCDQGEDGAVDGRRAMLGVVKQWWSSKDRREQDDLRQKLSRNGVKNGENHKEGVEDTGHGCGHPLKMNKNTGNSALGSGAAAAIMGGSGKISGGYGSSGSGDFNGRIGKLASEAAGGGALGSIVGALASGIGGSLLGELGGKMKPENVGHSSSSHNSQTGDSTQSYTEYGQAGNNYGQTKYSETQHQSGGHTSEYQRYEQSGSANTGSAYGQRTDYEPTTGGGYERKTEGWRKDEDDGKGKGHHKHHSRNSNERHGGRLHDKTESRQDEYGGRQSPPRQEYGGSRHDEEYGGGRLEYGVDRQEFGGRREEYAVGRRSPSRQKYGGSGRLEYGSGRQEFRERSEEYAAGCQSPPRQEYGGGRHHEEYSSGRQEYGGSSQEYAGSRQEYGRGRRETYEDDREERGGRREEYGSGGYGRQEERYGASGFGSMIGGGTGGFARGDSDERQKDYQETKKGSRGGGGWFS